MPPKEKALKLSGKADFSGISPLKTIAKTKNLAYLTIEDYGLGTLDLKKLPSTLRKLYLHNIGVESLPETGWERFPKLETLDISGNGLRSLPEGLAALQSLTAFSANNNQLTELPDFLLSAWSNLLHLSLNKNELKSLPSLPAGSLSALSYCSLEDNKLESLPDWLGECRSLLRLFLGKNQLRKLPETLHQLKSILTHDFEGCEYADLHLFDNPLQAEAISPALRKWLSDYFYGGNKDLEQAFAG